MKNTTLFFCLLLLVASCSTNRYLLADMGTDRYFLQQRIEESVKKGMISKTPMLVIDGRPFQYDVELKRQKLNLSRQDITQMDILKTEAAISVFGEMGKKGVVLITTSASRQDRGNSHNNVLVLLEGNKI